MPGQKITCFCPGLAQTKPEGLKDPARIFSFSSLSLTPEDTGSGGMSEAGLFSRTEQFLRSFPASRPPGP